jgi:hypothetical protein
MKRMMQCPSAVEEDWDERCDLAVRLDGGRGLVTMGPVFALGGRRGRPTRGFLTLTGKKGSAATYRPAVG